MKLKDSQSGVDEVITVGSCSIKRLRFAYYLVLLATSEQRLQHALDRFSAGYDHAGMKISTEKTDALFLTKNTRQCKSQVSDNTLQQVEKFKYLGVVSTSDGRRNKEIDTPIGKANPVLCELYRFVVTKG